MHVNCFWTQSDFSICKGQYMPVLRRCWFAGRPYTKVYQGTRLRLPVVGRSTVEEYRELLFALPPGLRCTPALLCLVVLLRGRA